MPPPQPPPYAKTRATPYREQTGAFAGRPIVVRDTHSHAAYRELTTSSQEHWPPGHLGLTTVAEDLAGKTGRSAGKQNDTSMALGKPAHEQAKGRGSKYFLHARGVKAPRRPATPTQLRVCCKNTRRHAPTTTQKQHSHKMPAFTGHSTLWQYTAAVQHPKPRQRPRQTYITGQQHATHSIRNTCRANDPHLLPLLLRPTRHAAPHNDCCSVCATQQSRVDQVSTVMLAARQLAHACQYMHRSSAACKPLLQSLLGRNPSKLKYKNR